MELSILTLRDYIGDYDFQLCSEGNTENAEKCLERGKLLVKSIYKKANQEDQYNETDEMCKEAILLSASSELYVRGKRFEDANQKRKQVQSLLVSVIGNAGKSYEDDEITTNKIKTVVACKRGNYKLNLGNF